jgi:hypothetical protein
MFHSYSPLSVLTQVLDLCTVMGHAFTLNPALQFQMFSYRIDLSSAAAAPEPGHWERVVGELQLSQQQLDEVAACWELSNKSLVRGNAHGLVSRQLRQHTLFPH